MAEMTLGGTTFRTKGAAKKRVQEILHGAVPGVPLAGEEHAIIQGLLQRHEHVDEKVGVGLKEIYVDLAPMGSPWGGNCFYVRRVDDSTTDFGYTKCFNKMTTRQKVHSAMREAVWQRFYKHEGFADTANRFLASRGETVDDVALEKSGDNEWGVCLADQQFAESWIAYVEGGAR